MIAAELGAEAVGRPESQGVEPAGWAAGEGEDVAVVDASVALRVAVAELAVPNVLLAEEERVAQPVGDVAETGHRFLGTEDPGRTTRHDGPDIDPRDERHAEGSVAALARNTTALRRGVVPNAGGIIAHGAGVVVGRRAGAREWRVGRVASNADGQRARAAGTAIRLDGISADGVAGGNVRALVVVQPCDVPLFEEVVLLHIGQDLHRPGEASAVVQPARRQDIVGVVVAVCGEGTLLEVVAALHSPRRLASHLHSRK